MVVNCNKWLLFGCENYSWQGFLKVFIHIEDTNWDKKKRYPPLSLCISIKLNFYIFDIKADIEQPSRQQQCGSASPRKELSTAESGDVEARLEETISPEEGQTFQVRRVKVGLIVVVVKFF